MKITLDNAAVKLVQFALSFTLSRLDEETEEQLFEATGLLAAQSEAQLNALQNQVSTEVDVDKKKLGLISVCLLKVRDHFSQADQTPEGVDVSQVPTVIQRFNTVAIS